MTANKRTVIGYLLSGLAVIFIASVLVLGVNGAMEAFMDYDVKLVQAASARSDQIAKAAEERFADIKKNITIAIMGCAVNGPGEAREADLGIAGGNGEGLIFAKGKIIKKVKEEELLDELLKEIDKL